MNYFEIFGFMLYKWKEIKKSWKILSIKVCAQQMLPKMMRLVNLIFPIKKNEKKFHFLILLINYLLFFLFLLFFSCALFFYLLCFLSWLYFMEAMIKLFNSQCHGDKILYVYKNWLLSISEFKNIKEKKQNEKSKIKTNKINKYALYSVIDNIIIQMFAFIHFNYIQKMKRIYTKVSMKKKTKKVHLCW